MGRLVAALWSAFWTETKAIVRASPLILRRWLAHPVGLAVPVVALTILLLAPQSADMLVGIEYRFQGGELRKSVCASIGLGVAAALMGVLAWYWMRAALMAELRVDDLRRADMDGAVRREAASDDHARRLDTADRWAPRMSLLVAGGIAMLPAYLPAEAQVESAAANLVCVAAAFIFVVKRHRLLRPFTRLFPDRLVIGPANGIWRFRTSSLFAAAPHGWWFALFVLGASALGVVMLEDHPGFVERNLHTPTVAVFALTLLIGPLVVWLAVLRDAIDLLATAATWLVCKLRGKCAPGPGEVRTPRPRWPGFANFLGVVALLAGMYALTPFGAYDARYAVREVHGWSDAPPGCDQHRAAVQGRRSDPRPCLEHALLDWYRAKRATLDWPSDRSMPLIVAAAAGGASRSAAWTLSGMRLLDTRTDGAFGQHLFGLVGVSGGSLAAVTYLHALAADGVRDPACSEQAQDPSACPRRPWLGHNDDKAGWQADHPNRGLMQLAQGDLLAAAIGTYFLNDTLARLFGLYIPPLTGRDVQLERAFERHWAWDRGFDVDRAVADRERVSFLRLRGALPDGAPHAVLLGMDAETGRRLVTATFRFDPRVEVFPDADDLLSLIRADVPASTAVTNSARFPFISPTGRFRPEGPVTGSADEVPYQVVDGGYYENYGAQTAYELVRAVEAAAARLTESGTEIAVTPIVVLFTNPANAVDGGGADGSADDADASPGAADNGTEASGAPVLTLQDTVIRCDWTPSLQARARARTAGQADDDDSPAGLLPEILAPFVGLLSIRDAHGRTALLDLRRHLCRAGENARMFNLALPKPDPAENQSAPMNWVLNPEAARFMTETAPLVPFNDEQASGLKQTLEQLRAGDGAGAQAARPGD